MIFGENYGAMECQHPRGYRELENNRFFSIQRTQKAMRGFLMSAILNAKLRGNDYGRERIRLALRYAFEITGVELIGLNYMEIRFTDYKEVL